MPPSQHSTNLASLAVALPVHVSYERVVLPRCSSCLQGRRGIWQGGPVNASATTTSNADQVTLAKKPNAPARNGRRGHKATNTPAAAAAPDSPPPPKPVPLNTWHMPRTDHARHTNDTLVVSGRGAHAPRHASGQRKAGFGEGLLVGLHRPRAVRAHAVAGAPWAAAWQLPTALYGPRLDPAQITGLLTQKLGLGQGQKSEGAQPFLGLTPGPLLSAACRAQKQAQNSSAQGAGLPVVDTGVFGTRVGGAQSDAAGPSEQQTGGEGRAASARKRFGVWTVPPKLGRDAPARSNGMQAAPPPVAHAAADAAGGRQPAGPAAAAAAAAEGGGLANMPSTAAGAATGGAAPAHGAPGPEPLRAPTQARGRTGIESGGSGVGTQQQVQPGVKLPAAWELAAVFAARMGVDTGSIARAAARYVST